MIQVDSLSVALGDVAVLEDVSLSVDPGTVLGLVGPNGAGKTTLLRTISGAITPDDGSVRIDGDDVHTLSSKAASRLVSVVPQDTTLSFAFDVRDVVAMGRTPHRSRFAPPTPEDTNIVSRALERTRTTHFADRPVDELSGGERQRVILARAIAQDTPVTLLDEPTASLDVNHQVETLELVRELAADGRTIVAAIHDLDLAARFCDELAVLADGVVRKAGSPEAVLTQDVLASAFEADAVVTPNLATGRPTVAAFPDRERDRTVSGRVHVIGTGSTAAAAVSRLATAGFATSLGPVAASDVAAEAARHLEVDVVEVAPFSPVSTDAVRSTRSRVEAADATVVAGRDLEKHTERILESVDRASQIVRLESASGTDFDPGDDEPGGRCDSIGESAIAARLENVVEVVRTVSYGERETPTERSPTDD